jgi:asparagine synthase (glutamine-hydrolysing)
MASGGVDSGLIWWATRESLAHAYTITWSTDDGENLGDDVAAVRDLEARFGTPVSYLRGESSQSVLPSSGDLFADPAYDLTRLIARTAHEAGFKVLLSGQGGDELFAGYRRHTVAPAVEHLRLGRAGKSFERLLRQVSGSGLRYEYLARLARATTEPDPFRGYMQLCSYSNATQRAEALGCTEAEVSNDVVWQRHREIFESLPKESSFLRRVMALDLAVYLPGLGLSYVDRAGMEFGVEIRVPWLDLELVRWSLTLPNNVLRQWGRGKWVTRELAAIELGRTIAQRPKRAFAAPAGVVDTPSSDAGADGYRQGAYFRRAKGLLDTYLATSLT